MKDELTGEETRFHCHAESVCSIATRQGRSCLNRFHRTHSISPSPNHGESKSLQLLSNSAVTKRTAFHLRDRWRKRKFDCREPSRSPTRLRRSCGRKLKSVDRWVDIHFQITFESWICVRTEFRCEELISEWAIETCWFRFLPKSSAT